MVSAHLPTFHYYLFVNVSNGTYFYVPKVRGDKSPLSQYVPASLQSKYLDILVCSSSVKWHPTF
jgi:hypothetical protein